MAPLCPEIFRKRAAVEGLYRIPHPGPEQIKRILLGLGEHLGMHPISDVLVFSPDAHSDLHHGIAGFVPWVESGCSLYTWDRQRLFTLEIYSCNDFDLDACARFAASALHARRVQAHLLSACGAATA